MVLDSPTSRRCSSLSQCSMTPCTCLSCLKLGHIASHSWQNRNFVSRTSTNARPWVLTVPPLGSRLRRLQGHEGVEPTRRRIGTLSELLRDPGFSRRKLVRESLLILQTQAHLDLGRRHIYIMGDQLFFNLLVSGQRERGTAFHLYLYCFLGKFLDLFCLYRTATENNPQESTGYHG